MAEKKKGFDLAAALGAVSNLDTGAVEGREQIEYIDIDRIHPDERNFYELPGIEELAANIEFAGLMDPLRVRPGDDGNYILVSGHRRHAAITLLVKEGKERFRQVACIVDKPSGQTTEVEAMLQELRLIYGNSDTRRMSSADLSRQAERVEMLLYQLKEAGVEFPGKMRDHVAEACKVSASKLARLKVIREKLIPPLKEKWEKGILHESSAYAFAQRDSEIQKMVMSRLKASKYDNDPRYWYESEVSSWADRIQKEKRLKCPHGHCKMCDNTEGRLAHVGGDWDNHCREGKCCSGCPHLASCKDACSHLADEIQVAKKEARERRAAEKEAKEKEDRPEVEQITALWARFAQARTSAGLSQEAYIKANKIYLDERMKKRWPQLEQGEKITRDTGLPYCGGNGFSLWSVRYLCRTADVLGVSVDYLLCRSDEPGGSTTPVPAAASNSGQTPLQFVDTPELPQRDGPYYCRLSVDGEELRRVLYWSTQFKTWSFKSRGPSIDAVCLGWFPLPGEQSGQGGDDDG